MEKDNAKRLAKNTVLLFIRMVIVLLISLYTTRVVFKALGVDNQSIYNVVGSVVIFFGFLKNALTNATSRYLTFELGTGNREKLRQIYSMAINCHIILAAILLLLLEIGGVWFINHQLNIDPSRMAAANWVFQFSLLTFCLGIVQTPFHSNLIAHEKMGYYAFLSILDAVLKLVVAYLLYISPVDKLISYGFLLCVEAVIIFCCYAFYSSRKFDDTEYIKFWDKGIVGEFASYSGWSLLVNGADIATQQCIGIFFFNLLGKVANVSLGFANQVSAGIGMFVANFSQSYKPQIVKSYASGDNDYFHKLIFSASKISFLLYLLVAVPIVANVDFVLKIWLGDYPEFTPAYIAVIIVYFLFDSFQEPLWQAVHATGKLRTHQIMIASIKVLAIPAMYLVLKSGSSGTVALGIWACLNVACAVSRTIYMHFLIGLDLKAYLFKVILPLVLLFVAAVPLPIWVAHRMGSNFGAFVVSSAIAVAVILLVGVAVVLDRSERSLLKGVPVIGKFIK